jgi:hypothetical protein
MKKFLIAGSSLAAVAAAGSAGAVDVTLGGSIELGFEFGVGKDVNNVATFKPDSAYQAVTLNLAAAGTTDGGMKFGGSFALSTADELKLDLYDTNGTVAGGKHLAKLTNSEGEANIAGAAYNVSGGAKIAASKIVSVKINSAWQGAEDTTTGYYGAIESIAGTSDVCKIAGREEGTTGSPVIARLNTTANALIGQTIAVSGSAYLPAGQLTGSAGNTLQITAQNSAMTAFIAVNGTSSNTAAPSVGNAIDNGKFSVGHTQDYDAYANAAQVYAGPFMEVMLTSSTTKMVVGAVCVTNAFEASETAAYLDLASRVMQVGQASIFIEGGFGKLTLQQGKYTGKVAAIGAAGDQAEIDAGLVAVLEGASMMGMSGYAAVDVTTLNTAGRPNYLLGTTVDLMGLSVAVEFEDDNANSDDATNVMFIDAWDASTSYAIGDLAIDAALDSDGDWGLKASATVAGFAATSVIENVAANDNEKAGLSIDTTLATSFNGIGVSIGLDENLDYTLTGSYSIGNSGLSISVGYDSEEEGGAVAAKLAF